MWWPKALTYGNWGGPGWSGGRFESDRSKVDWSVKPVDAMDEAFKLHDLGYQTGEKRSKIDLHLVRTLWVTDAKGIWPNMYRIGAMTIFSVKAYLGK